MTRRASRRNPSNFTVRKYPLCHRGKQAQALLNTPDISTLEAKRRALDEIAARQRGADEKRKEAERREQVALVSQPAVIQ